MFNDVNFTTCLIFILVFFLAYWSLSKRTSTNIPGPFALPVVGNLIGVIRSQRTGKQRGLFFRKYAKEYGSIFRLYFGPYLVVIISSYDLIQKAFVKHGDKTSERPNWLPNIRLVTKEGKGIVWQNWNEAKVFRRFALQTMRDFGVGKVTVEERVLEEVNALCTVFNEQANQPISVKRMLTVAISNIIHNIVFGFRYEHSDERFKKLLNCFDVIFTAPAPFLSPVSLLPWLKYIIRDDRSHVIKSRNEILSYIREQITEHKSSYDQNNIRDFVDLYIKAENEEFSNKDIFNKGNLFRAILDLFTGGTETTASTLNWSLLYMIGYPHIQQKCQQEIDTVVGTGRMARMSDRSKLKYVEATLMEIQRISNIAQATLPHEASEDINLDGYLIPKGAILIASLSSCHFDSDQWDEPEKFKPERFLDTDGNVLKNENLIPFSIGPRICIGESLAKMELFLIFVNLLQRFTFTKATEDKVLDYNGVTGLTTVPAPYTLRATAR